MEACMNYLSSINKAISCILYNLLCSRYFFRNPYNKSEHSHNRGENEFSSIKSMSSVQNTKRQNECFYSAQLTGLAWMPFVMKPSLWFRCQWVAHSCNIVLLLLQLLCSCLCHGFLINESAIALPVFYQYWCAVYSRYVLGGWILQAEKTQSTIYIQSGLRWASLAHRFFFCCFTSCSVWFTVGRDRELYQTQSKSRK